MGARKIWALAKAKPSKVSGLYPLLPFTFYHMTVFFCRSSSATSHGSIPIRSFLKRKDSLTCERIRIAYSEFVPLGLSSHNTKYRMGLNNPLFCESALETPQAQSKVLLALRN
jgi:hypothetical protein